MTQPAKVQEPSMEEILASIRRIIADDEAKPEELNGAGDLAMPVIEQPAAASRVETPRVHNIAAVASHPAVSQPAPSRGDTKPMTAGVEKSVSSSSPRGFGSGASAPAPIKPAAVVAPTASVTALHEEADVFDLTDDMAIPTGNSGFRKVEPKDDLEFAEPPAPTERREPPRPAAPVPPPRAAEPPPVADDILSKQTASAVESAFNSLASTVLSANSRTLEDLVKEMMRPMLKNWLDDNLPGLVERIVKAEIERVARGR